MGRMGAEDPATAFRPRLWPRLRASCAYTPPRCALPIWARRTSRTKTGNSR